MARAVKNPAKRAAAKSAAKAAPGMATPYLSAGERRAEGKALRDQVPRDAHAGWKAPKHRRDPVALLSESNEGRLADLIPIRFGRMGASPFSCAHRVSSGSMPSRFSTAGKRRLIMPNEIGTAIFGLARAE